MCRYAWESKTTVVLILCHLYWLFSINWSKRLNNQYPSKVLKESYEFIKNKKNFSIHILTSISINFYFSVQSKSSHYGSGDQCGIPIGLPASSPWRLGHKRPFQHSGALTHLVPSPSPLRPLLPSACQPCLSCYRSLE